MSYATPSDYLAHYGDQWAAEFLDRSTPPVLTGELLRAVVDGADLSDWTADEQLAAQAAVGRLTSALALASRTVDTFLLHQVRLPLAQEVVDANPLGRYVLAIATYDLAAIETLRTDAIRDDHRAAVDWLTRLAQGKVGLVGLERETAAPVGRTTFRSGRDASGSAYDWEAFG